VPLKDKKQLPKQFELFTAMSFVMIDPQFDQPALIQLTGECINNATSMQRFGIIHPDTVFERLQTFKGSDSLYQKWSFCGVQVVVTPKRLRSFYNNLKCIECGRTGNVFLIERHTNDNQNQYLNLYSVDETGIVLMTVDHILPDSWYGRYDPANFQTMCRTCNQKKQHVMSVAEIERVRADITSYAKAWVVPEFLDRLLQLQLIIHDTFDPQARLMLNRIMERYRKRIKHDMKRPVVLKMLVDMNAEIRDIVASHHGAMTCQSTNVVHAEQQVCTEGSWKQKMKRWFASLVAGVVGLHPVQQSSQGANVSRTV
jgi:HNH endonuclease